jgi:integrase
MAIIEKKAVLKSIRRCERMKGGKPYLSFEIYFGTDGHGNKIRETRSTEADAKLRVEEFFRTYKKVGDAATLLTAAEMHDASEALKLLAEAGIKSTITDAIRKFVGSQTVAGGVIHQRTLLDAYDEYYAAIPEIQRLHRKSVVARIRPWVTHTGPSRMMDSVTSREVAEYLKDKRKSLKTYNNCLSYIKTFLNWGTKSERRYLAASPLEDMKKERLAYSEPEFMPADDLDRLLRAVEARKDARHLIPYLVLSYFCGVRREEIARLCANPRDLLLDEESIRISQPKGWTQGIAPRIFKLQTNALAWLKAYYDGKKLCKSNSACMYHIDAVAKKIGVTTLGRNTGRHSFITYHVAAFSNPAMTDAITGTSSRMRSAHYQGLATKSAADAFFAIMPTVKGVAQSPAT